MRAYGAKIVASYTDIESGKNDDRTQLAAAIGHAEKIGARLVVATLDRLSRDVAYISGLMKRGVDFVAADMPGASTFELHIRAAIAQEERRKISERTKAALAAAKARGVKLGGYHGYVPTKDAADKGRAYGRVAAAARVRSYLSSILPNIEALRDQRLSLNAIARALTAQGVMTPFGTTKWHPVQVQRVLARAAA